ncbi:MAG: hypothetical protein IJ426_02785 [Clostridia bacterium]|nr:hypothetical protein [Clostridia bacterium]
MKQVIFSSENPKGLVVEIESTAEATPIKDPITEFFEGLASADTNSIAKIRALAKEFLTNTEEA